MEGWGGFCDFLQEGRGAFFGVLSISDGVGTERQCLRRGSTLCMFKKKAVVDRSESFTHWTGGFCLYIGLGVMGHIMV